MNDGHDAGPIQRCAVPFPCRAQISEKMTFLIGTFPHSTTHTGIDIFTMMMGIV